LVAIWKSLNRVTYAGADQAIYFVERRTRIVGCWLLVVLEPDAEIARIRQERNLGRFRRLGPSE
jgi:hypothetical protein